MSNVNKRLMLMIALALPGAAHALGLGEIHVKSALNEPLAAEIDIVGASPDDLAGIAASVADRETFLHFGAARSEVLAGATFNVAEDGRGRPVLAIRSQDSFTEPYVDMLVDLRWRSGKLIRRYSLLLDPAGLQSATRITEPLPSAGHGTARAARIGVAPHASDPRASDPRASDPRAAVTAAAPSNDAAEAALNHRVQVLENSLTELKGVLDREREEVAALQAPPDSGEQAPAAAKEPAEAPARHVVRWSMAAAAIALTAAVFGVISALRRRRRLKQIIASAERETEDSEAAAVSDHSVVSAPQAAGAPANYELLRDVRLEAELAAKREAERSLAAAELRERAGLAARFLDDIDTEALESSYIDEVDGGGADDTMNPWGAGRRAELAVATQKIRVDDANAETVRIETVRVDAVPPIETPAFPAPARGIADSTASADKLPGEETKLDYNLEDLDTTVQHVPMPSRLHDNVGFKERRTSLEDVLKKAIEREPNRSDLRMKLLETYYAAAATNCKGFIEVVQKFAGDRGTMPDEYWHKIASMGRHIAPDCELFAPDNARTDEDDLANCA